MKSTWSIGLGIALLLLAAEGLAAAAADPIERTEPIAREAFAERVTLTPKAEHALHTLLLPEAVYQGLAQPDFADLRVYNRAGQQVPHAVRPLPVLSEEVTKSTNLPLFPLRAAPGSADPATAVVLYALRDSGGAIVTIRPERAAKTDSPLKKHDAPNTPESQGKIVAYVVDASGWTEPVDALEITVGPEPGDYVVPVSVDASDDLSHFKRVGETQSLVRLEYGGQRIERTRIKLPRVSSRYLRLSWSGTEAPAFQTVRAESGSLRREETLHSRKLSGRWLQPGELALYDLGGAVPLDQVRVLLLEDNTLVNATLEVATAQDGPFTKLSQGTFYRVRHEGELLESLPVPVVRTGARFLRLHVSRQGGGAGASPPDLEVSHHPDQLLFASRGEPPFELVYGHYGAPPSAFSPQELLAMLPLAARIDLPASDTTLGPVHPLAGPSARVPPAPGPPLKKYALWGVLVAAVGALALMALRLARAQSPQDD